MRKLFYRNKVRDIGTKYLGLGLSKLIKLTNLELLLYKIIFIFINKIGDIGSKYLGLGLSRLIKLISLGLYLRLEIFIYYFLKILFALCYIVKPNRKF